jgi:Spy/CpxP family protein refolding chaperone
MVRATGLLAFTLMVGVGPVLAQTNTTPPRPLTDAQKAAIRSIQNAIEQRAAPVALQLSAVVMKLYENNLSETPNEDVRQKLDAQMKDLVWQALQLKGEAMWAAFRVLTPEQRALVRADVEQPRKPGDLPDVLDIIAHRFGDLGK